MQTFPIQLRSNFQKVQKTTFLTKMVKNAPHKGESGSNDNFEQNLNFCGRLLIFCVENMALAIKRQSKFRKVKKMTVLSQNKTIKTRI